MCVCGSYDCLGNKKKPHSFINWFKLASWAYLERILIIPACNVSVLFGHFAYLKCYKGIFDAPHWLGNWSVFLNTCCNMMMSGFWAVQFRCCTAVLCSTYTTMKKPPHRNRSHSHSKQIQYISKITTCLKHINVKSLSHHSKGRQLTYLLQQYSSSGHTTAPSIKQRPKLSLLQAPVDLQFYMFVILFLLFLCRVECHHYP